MTQNDDAFDVDKAWDNAVGGDETDNSEANRIEGFENWKAEREWVAEQQAVKRVLSFYGLESVARRMGRKLKDKTGEAGKLSFLWFYEFFPTFPVRLVSKRVPYLHTWNVPSLLTSFTKSPVWRAFDSASETIPEDYQTGLIGVIFNWPKLGAMVISNYDQGLPANHAIFATVNGQAIWIERLKNFLTRVNWTPPDLSRMDG